MINYKSEYAGVSCKFSPLKPNILSCCFSENYGIIGKGKLLVFSFNNDKTNKKLTKEKELLFENCLTDLEFSPEKDNVIFVGDNSGFVYFVDFVNNKITSKFPVHKKDILSLSTKENLLVTTCSNGTAKIFDINNANLLIKYDKCFNNSPVTYANFHPNEKNIVSFTNLNGNCFIFDMRKSGIPVKCFVNNVGLTSCSFSDSSILLSDTSGLIHLYDLRKDNNIPVKSFVGHKLTCKKVKFTLNNAQTFVSCGYDMNLYKWNINNSLPIKEYNHHSEFVTGFDLSQQDQSGLICSTSFDKTVDLFYL